MRAKSLLRSALAGLALAPSGASAGYHEQHTRNPQCPVIGTPSVPRSGGLKVRYVVDHQGVDDKCVIGSNTRVRQTFNPSCPYPEFPVLDPRFQRDWCRRGPVQ